MLFNKKMKFKLFSHVENPYYIVFCDFDETYYPHTMTKDRQRDLSFSDRRPPLQGMGRV